MTQQEIFQNMTKGEWRLTRYCDGQYSLHIDDNYYEIGMPELEDEANSEAIKSAIANTYNKGINPEGVEKLLKAVETARKTFNNYEKMDASEIHDITLEIEEALTAATLHQ